MKYKVGDRIWYLDPTKGPRSGVISEIDANFSVGHSEVSYELTPTGCSPYSVRRSEVEVYRNQQELEDQLSRWLRELKEFRAEDE